MNNTKNYLLTDFTTERWKNINMENVKSQIEKLNEKINKFDCLYGQIGNPYDKIGNTYGQDASLISLSKASHSIKNLTFNDGKVYGDVEFLNNDNGKQADNFINNLNFKFGIRCICISEQYNNGELIIESIITWDIGYSS